MGMFAVWVPCLWVTCGIVSAQVTPVSSFWMVHQHCPDSLVFWDLYLVETLHLISDISQGTVRASACTKLFHWVYVWVCICMCVCFMQGLCGCSHMCGRQSWHQVSGVLSYTSYFLRKDLSQTPWLDLARWITSDHRLILPHPYRWHCRQSLLIPDFYPGSRNPHLGPPACVVNTLQTESSPRS